MTIHYIASGGDRWTDDDGTPISQFGLTIRRCQGDRVMRLSAVAGSKLTLDYVERADIATDAILRPVRHYTGDPFVDDAFGPSVQDVEITEAEAIRLQSLNTKRQATAQREYLHDAARVAAARDRITDMSYFAEPGLIDAYDFCAQYAADIDEARAGVLAERRVLRVRPTEQLAYALSWLPHHAALRGRLHMTVRIGPLVHGETVLAQVLGPTPEAYLDRITFDDQPVPLTFIKALRERLYMLGDINEAIQRTVARHGERPYRDDCDDAPLSPAHHLDRDEHGKFLLHADGTMDETVR